MSDKLSFQQAINDDGLTFGFVNEPATRVGSGYTLTATPNARGCVELLYQPNADVLVLPSRGQTVMLKISVGGADKTMELRLKRLRHDNSLFRATITPGRQEFVLRCVDELVHTHSRSVCLKRRMRRVASKEPWYTARPYAFRA
jgi:hypothetical protein